MSYSAAIDRMNPSAFVFLIDQSGSMDEQMTDVGQSKAQFVADVLNKTLHQLILRCTRRDGLRNYFDVGVVAYGGLGVRPGFGGTLSNSIMHSLADIYANPMSVEERTKREPDGAGGLIPVKVKFPTWFAPVSEGGTPMCEGLRTAMLTLQEWCDRHRGSYPPTLIHVTDGQSTDGDPEPLADMVRQIATDDGACLIFNLHIDAASAQATIFPHTEQLLPDEYSRAMYRMSSPFPVHLLGAAREKGYEVQDGARFFGYKAGYEGVVDFFDIGTRSDNMR